MMTLYRFSLALLISVFAFQAQAEQMPKRKSGLWEVKTKIAGQPEQGAAQMCIDKEHDSIIQQKSSESINCEGIEVSKTGNKTNIHAVCKENGVTITTDSVITGNFESSYHNNMTISYDIPKQEKQTIKISQDARWLGPCKPGQKPGDIIIPGMPAINVKELMQ